MAAKDISKTLVLKDGVSATLKKIIGGTVEYKKRLKELKDQGTATWESIKTGVGAAAAAAGVASTAMVGMGIKANSSAEMAEKSFDILLGSAGAAKKMVSDLQVLATSSPFEFAGLQDAAKTLLGMGFAGQQVVPLMHSLGNAVAAVGGNTDTMKGIALAMGQIQAKGKLSSEEVNQLAERGVPVWSLLAKEMGKTPAELMKLAEQGKLLSNQVLPMLVTGLNKRFAGSMQEMSSTFEYTVANIRETATLGLGQVTKSLFGEIKNDLKGVQALMASDAAGQWGARFSSALVSIYNGTKAVAGAIWTVSSFVANNWSVIGPIVYGITGALAIYKTSLIAATLWTALFGKESTFTAAKTALMGTAALVTSGQIGIMTAAQRLFNLALTANPIGMVITAIGLLITAGVYLVQNWDTVKAKGKEVWNVVVGAAEWAVNENIKFANLLLSTFKFAWDSIKFGAVNMWNAIVSSAQWGVQNMLTPLNAAIEAVGGQKINVNFGAAKFADAVAPTWDSKMNVIPQVDFGRAKFSNNIDDIAIARKEQQDARASRDRKLADALNANTAALAFNTDATAGNTDATKKNTNARLKDDMSSMDLADSLLARIERHVWATG